MVRDIPELASFLTAIQKELKALPSAERDDVIQEITSHLEAAIQAGEAPPAILERMGPPQTIAQAWAAERLITVDRRRSPQEIAGILLKAALGPFAWGMLAFTLVMLLNTWYLYRNWQAIDVGTQAHVLLYSLPAIVVVALPIAMLLVGLFGVPALARSLSRPLFRQTLPRLAVSILAAGFLVSALGLLFNDSVVIRANRATIDLQRGVLHLPVNGRSPQELTLRELGARIHDAETTTRNVGELKGLRTDYQVKWSLPFASLTLAALGLALGSLIAGRSGTFRLLQLFLAIVVIAGWYVLFLLGRNFGFSGGRYAPWVGGWLANVVTIGAAALIGLVARWKWGKAHD